MLQERRVTISLTVTASAVLIEAKEMYSLNLRGTCGEKMIPSAALRILQESVLI